MSLLTAKGSREVNRTHGLGYIRAISNLVFLAIGFQGLSQTTKIPFDGIDITWQNGSDRRDSSVFKDMKYFTPSVLLDLNYTYSFSNPIDNTVIGSTALARNNEVQLSALHFGGDFSYQNARARFMTQFGTRSIVVPRNDYSQYKGQYQLGNV